MAIEAAQQEALYRAKLTSLVRSHFSAVGADTALELSASPAGAVARYGANAWVLIESERPEVALGTALVATAAAKEVHLLVANDPSLLARRAQGFSDSPTIWSIVGTALAPAEPSATVAPHAEVPAVGVEPMVDLMRSEGLEIVVEDGSVIGELLGLEVARVVESDGATRLDVGVGAYDQEAFAVLNAGMSATEGLAAVCSEVRQYRAVGADTHSLNRLSRERWLRADLVANPSQIGLNRLAPVPASRPRSGLKELMPAGAMGTDNSGALVAVLCSVGVDLDLVPAAADMIVLYRPDRVVLVIPERDRYPVVERMAARLRVPTEIIAATEPWGRRE